MIRSLGVAMAGILAGCPSDEFDGDPSAPSSGSETPASADDTSTADAETEIEDPGELGTCGPGPRSKHAWPQTNQSATNGRYVAVGSTFSEPPSVDWSKGLPIETPDRDGPMPRFTNPIVDGDRVYVFVPLDYLQGTDPPDAHYLVCWDAASGETRWQYAFPGEARPEEFLQPVFHDGSVLVSYGRTLVAVDAETGDERWSRELGTALDSLVVAGNELYSRDHDDTISALAPDGTTEWTASLQGDLRAGPVVGGRYVYAADETNVYAVDPMAETVTWITSLSRKDGNTVVRGVTATGCGVFVVTNDRVFALDHEGTVVWKGDSQWPRLATDGETIYVRDNVAEKSLQARDAATGELRWERTGEYGSLVATDEALYTTRDGKLVGLDVADGTDLWAAEYVVTNLVLAGETFYGIRGGNFVAMR